MINFVKAVIALIAALPQVIDLVKQLQKVIYDMKEKQRADELADAANQLKRAQGVEDEEAQRKALDRIVDDYNR